MPDFDLALYLLKKFQILFLASIAMKNSAMESNIISFTQCVVNTVRFGSVWLGQMLEFSSIC